MSGIITDRKTAREFVLSGRAVFTMVSVETGTRFTFRVRKSDRDGIWFVDTLTGPDNENDFAFTGNFFQTDDGLLRFKLWQKFVRADDAPSVRALEWLAFILSRDGDMPRGLEFWHSGRCGRCGHALTTPESIARGLGPRCAEYANS